MPVNPVTQVTQEKKEKFLEALRETCNVTDAARIAKVHRKTIYEHRKNDPEFAEAFEEAREFGIDSLEDKVMKRAKYGTLKPVYQQGKKVGDIREYSDTLAIFLLKGNRPEKYKDRVEQKITGNMSVDFGGWEKPEDEGK